MNFATPEGGVRVPITVNVQMDDRVFSDFAAFDSIVLPRRWQKVALFVGVMLALALLNLFTGAQLLFWVLLIIGLITPLSFLIQFRQSIVAQIKRFRLETPKPVYRLTFPPEGETFQMQATDQPEQTLAWHDLAGAYLTRKALYLYAAPRQAYIVPLHQLQPGEGATLWAMARQSVAQGKARAYTRKLPDAA